jgi:hypothetical protein
MKSNSTDNNSNKCLRQFSDGRTCRMLRKKDHPSLCIHHAREEEQRLESEKLAAEFASLSGKLNTVTDINHVLGKVFTALAESASRTRPPTPLATSASSYSNPYPASKANSMPPCSTPAPTTPCYATQFPSLAASASNNAKIHPQAV